MLAAARILVHSLPLLPAPYIHESLRVVEKFRFCRLQLFLFLSLFAYSVHAQDYNYVQYTMKDGLAGSTVFDVCQDKDGFIWFATDAGLSRFDGTQFKNFTIADGLPELEILRLFADSKGRVWFAPFKNMICYYYKGKIYTKNNNVQLKQVQLESIPMIITENRKQDILISAMNTLFLIGADTTNGTNIKKYTSASVIQGAGFDCPPSYDFTIWRNDSLFWIIQGKDVFKQVVEMRKADSRYLVRSYTGYNTVYIKKPPGSSTTTMVGKYLFLNSTNGSWFVDTLTWDRYSAVFLPDKSVNVAMVDSEQNFWFGTNGEGAFKLTSRNIRTYRGTKGGKNEIFSIEKQHGLVLGGSNNGLLYMWRKEMVDSTRFEQYLSLSNNVSSSNRLVCMLKTEYGLLLGYDAFLIKYNLHTRKQVVNLTSIFKSLAAVDAETVIGATARSVVLINTRNLKVTDTVWSGRSTAAIYYDDAYYIGTVEGLNIVSGDRSVERSGEKFKPLFTRTSAFAKCPDGSLWVGTYGNGIIRMKGREVTAHLTTKDGLSSNVCRTLFFHQNKLWVGTDQGITRINVADPLKGMHYYSTADGLPSNQVNALYVDGDTVYVGSPAGLTSFDETKLSANSKCELKILELSVSGKPRLPDSIGHLSYQENSMKIAFVGISYKSGGEILYRYRLKGMQDKWDSTRQTVLDFPALPPGEFELELMAINKFGVQSAPLTITFSIAAPFWKTAWFQFLVIGISVVLIWLGIYRRFQVIRKRYQEKSALKARMNDLEQQALRSQMNPHFIFNCLNSIQNFIVHNDFETTNQYLTEFSYLIRQTLDNSTKSTITLDNEVTYLTRYLEMEKMRFSHSFDYRFEIDPSIDRELVHIPAMLLQPYVENSIRHGVRYIKEGGGLITIKFQKEGQTLICIIQDNGIGRKKASEFKSQLHVEYQSKGMTLTAERILILNRQLEEPITIEVNDLLDPEYKAAGTKITIRFPNTIIT